MKNARIVSLVLLCIGVLVSVDLGLNYLNSTFIEVHDGFSRSGIFAFLLFNDDGYTIYDFFRAFSTATIITTALFIENIILFIISIKQIRK